MTDHTKALEAMPELKWIQSNWQPNGGAMLHLGRRQDLRGSVSGKLKSVYYVTACSGRTLNSAFGITTYSEAPPCADICRRCQSIFDKLPDKAAPFQPKTLATQEQDTPPGSIDASA